VDSKPSYSYPQVEKTEDTLIVRVRAVPTKTRAVQMPMVLDLDRYGDVIGIELISVRYHSGDNLFRNLDWEAINSQTHVGLRYSEPDDVLYVRLQQDRAIDQRSVHGRLILDSDGNLVSLETALR
jgi:uncharacterized protein YuzE